MGQVLFEKAYLINDFILRHKIVSNHIEILFNYAALASDDHDPTAAI